METPALKRVCKNPFCGKAFLPSAEWQVYCCSACTNLRPPEKCREWQRRSQAKISPQKRRANARRWRARNPEKCREQRRRDRAQGKAKKSAFFKLAFLWKLEQIVTEVEAVSAKESAGELDRARAEVHAWDTERLKGELAQGLRVVRERLLTLSAVLAELDARGEEVTGDRHLLKLLRKIGSGQLLVDAVVRFAGRPYVLASVAAMPVPEQARVMAETDAEVEARFHTRKRPAPPAPVAPAEFPGPAPGAGARPSLPGAAPAPHGETAHLPTTSQLGSNGTVKDVVAFCLDVVRASADPAAVAELLLPRLQELKQSRQKRGARPA